MKYQTILSIVACAMMATTAWAQDAGPGCTSDGYTGNPYTNPGTIAESAGHGCHRPWTYQQASALWAGYCTEQYVGDDGCGCCWLSGMFGHLAAPAACRACGQRHCGGCPPASSQWPCQSADACGSSCFDGCGNGLLDRIKLPAFGCHGRCGGALAQICGAAPCRSHGHSSCDGCCGRVGAAWAGIGCCTHDVVDSIQEGFRQRGCYNDCRCDVTHRHRCCGGRHGIDLFGALKRRGIGCGLSAGCGCDVPAVSPSCDCN